MTTDTPLADAQDKRLANQSDFTSYMSMLDFARTLERDLSAMRERVVKYRARLEVDHHAEDFGGTLERVDLPFDEDEPYDGIDCRDETIRLLDQARDEMRTDLSECRAALAERQAAIDELVACDYVLQEVLAAGRANPHNTQNWPQIHGRNVAAWSTARALATKEPTK